MTSGPVAPLLRETEKPPSETQGYADVVWRTDS